MGFGMLVLDFVVLDLELWATSMSFAFSGFVLWDLGYVFSWLWV
jgi:hypothetical protein